MADFQDAVAVALAVAIGAVVFLSGMVAYLMIETSRLRGRLRVVTERVARLEGRTDRQPDAR